MTKTEKTRHSVEIVLQSFIAVQTNNMLYSRCYTDLGNRALVHFKTVIRPFLSYIKRSSVWDLYHVYIQQIRSKMSVRFNALMFMLCIFVQSMKRLNST